MNTFGVMRKQRRMSEQEMEQGWYCGLASRFSNHYYTKIKKDDIQSRCGQINLKMLRGQSVTSLKPANPNSRNNCRGCQNLLNQDKEHETLSEPHRY